MTRYLLLLAFVLLIGLVSGGPQVPRRPSQRRPGSRPAPTKPPAAAPAAASDDTTDECPEPNGYFADAEQCDKYYECIDGQITEKLCPDGQVFNDFSPEHEKCDLPFGIDCSQRPALQTPQARLHCRRKHGYFPHEEKNVCDKFYYCVDGMFNMLTCPDGLVFNEKIGICSWPEEASKKYCSSADVFNFTCPKVSEEVAHTHPRYADPDDCQFFFVCINGETPRRNGCKRGQVFSEDSRNCEWPRKVPECKDWYKGIISDEELARLENPVPKTRNPNSPKTKTRTRPAARE